MNRTLTHEHGLIEWGVASCPIEGETESGDLHLVKPFDHGILLAALDGVGHGDEAIAAARAAIAVLEQHAAESVISLVKRCHEALAKTRGVVLTLASLNTLQHTLAWLGVGNVEGLLLRADAAANHPAARVLLRGGLVGYQLPALHASVLPITRGDLLIFATDGIRPGFEADVHRGEAPDRIAGRIMSGHFKGNDDALVLVARYLGRPDE